MDTLESQLLLKSVRKFIVLASFDHTFIHFKFNSWKLPSYSTKNYPSLKIKVIPAPPFRWFHEIYLVPPYEMDRVCVTVMQHLRKAMKQPLAC